MSELDSEIRSYIEAGIDGILNDPSSYETTIRDALKAMDVDQNHETIISVIAGLCLSATLVHSERIYGKIREQDLKGLYKLLKRRAREIREAFALTRIE